MIDIFAKTKQRLLTPPFTDMSRESRLFPPLDESQIVLIENALGFSLPATLRQLYINVSDGSFGPGSGLFSSPLSVISYGGHSIVEEYLAQRIAKPSSAPDDDEQQWPIGLLPLCNWGCSIMSSVFCTLPNTPVVRNDPNRSYAEIVSFLSKDQRLDNFGRVFGCSWIESPSFDQWFEDWLHGADLFNAPYRGL